MYISSGLCYDLTSLIPVADELSSSSRCEKSLFINFNEFKFSSSSATIFYLLFESINQVIGRNSNHNEEKEMRKEDRKMRVITIA